jgi:hypothetical protein
MALTGTAYLTAAQFQDHLTGMDLTGITDAQLLDYIRQASRLADHYIRGTFDVMTRSERQVWSNVRRFYPNALPVHAVRDLVLHIGGGQTATIAPTDLFINNQGGYIEVVSLATAVGLSAELVSLGLVQVVAHCTYKTGGGVRSDDPATQGVVWGGSTTLAEAVDSTETGIDVVDASGLAVNDIIRVDDEVMWITAIAVNTLTVVRAAQTDASPDAHDNGADVEWMAIDLTEDVELAVAMITGALIAARRQNEEGVTGVRSFMIGSYSVTYGSRQQMAGGSGYPYIPEAAQAILDEYRQITLR